MRVENPVALFATVNDFSLCNPIPSLIWIITVCVDILQFHLDSSVILGATAVSCHVLPRAGCLSAVGEIIPLYSTDSVEYIWKI